MCQIQQALPLSWRQPQPEPARATERNPARGNTTVAGRSWMSSTNEDGGSKRSLASARHTSKSRASVCICSRKLLSPGTIARCRGEKVTSLAGLRAPMLQPAPCGLVRLDCPPAASRGVYRLRAPLPNLSAANGRVRLGRSGPKQQSGRNPRLRGPTRRAISEARQSRDSQIS